MLGTGLQESLFYELVNNVADQFAGDSSVMVSDEARTLLIELALPYTSRVEQELSEGSITREFLSNSLYTVLDNALQVGQDRGDLNPGIGSGGTINVAAVHLSMQRYCPYLFWC